MKPNASFVTSAAASVLALFPVATSAATFTWDGEGADAKWSAAANWAGDVAPAATNDTLVFAGSANTATENDLVVSINAGPSITFAAGAGSFNLGGNAITLGSGGGGGITIVSQQSANPQTISAPVNLSGGNGDRTITFASGAGSLTFAGNINFNNDWLFPNTTAGTIVLAGTNSGDGKATNAITAGTNTMRAMMRNNIAGTSLVLANDSALGNRGAGNATAGTAGFRGVIANQNLFVRTDANRNLSGSTIAINAGWVDFNSSSNLTIGNLINTGGNRDLKHTGSGALTIDGGIFLSGDQTSRQLYLNLAGSGELTLLGAIHNTFHSGGIATLGVSDLLGQKSLGNFRKAGTGRLILNGDSSGTFGGEVRIEGGTVVLGHPGALGAASSLLTLARTGDTFLDDRFVTLNSATDVVVGMTVSGPGIPAGTTVVAVTALTVELSEACTDSVTGANLAFSITKASPTYVGSAPNFGTLDLNGQTIAEPIAKIEGNGAGGTAGALVNSNTTTPAAITTDLTGVYSFSINGPGDITVPRLIATGNRVITKNGTGTFTTAGNNHNNLCGWIINAGTVVFANTAGLGSDRGTTINGGTLRLSGTNSNLINDTQDFTVNGGSFDLNGKGEAVASINGTGGEVTNNGANAATLYVGGGTGGSSSGTFAGAIRNGSGILHLHKEGSGTQVLTGTLGYSGDTSVSQTGTLGITSASLDDASTVSIAAQAFLNLDFTGADTVAALIIDGAAQPNGEYGATGSGAAHETDRITGTGRLVVAAAAPAGYDTWQSANAPGQTIDLDHDGDGVPNGVEYFMGLSGSAFTANPTPSAGTVTWPMGASYTGTYGTDYRVQTSENLVDWIEVPQGSGKNTVQVTSGVSVVYDMPDQGRRFFRLVVVR
jgi:autotransporter-associated beta strand protein